MNTEVDEDLKTEYFTPATNWVEAAPVGNGRLGAMVFGGVPSELIQLNEDTLWTGAPRDSNNPNAAQVLPKVRKLVWEGRYSEATDMSYGMLGPHAQVYQPLGDIKLDFEKSHSAYDPNSYHRQLDLNTAIASTQYVVSEVEFTREVFASFPHQIIAIKVAASKPASVSLSIVLDSPLQKSADVEASKLIVVQGQCPLQMTNGGKMEGALDGMSFAAVLDVRISEKAGSVEVTGKQQLQVKNADWVVLLLAASSSYDGPFKLPVKKDPVGASLAVLKAVESISYDNLRIAHIADYQKLFNRVSLQLESKKSQTESDKWHSQKLSTQERIIMFSKDEDPKLVSLLFHFGRYLLISSSRPGTFVSNLQGIWNKDLDPVWRCVPTLNINLEMNYWPAETCNLAECHEPLFDLISSISINGSVTAKVNYNMQGWVTHHNVDIWAQTAPASGDPKHSLWPMGGAWLCLHLWEHYTFSLDKEFLRVKAYPLIQGSAQFLYDWLVPDSKGLLVTNPSTSPEHKFITSDGKEASVSYATAMDMAIIRAVFSATISAAKVLKETNMEFISNLEHAQHYLYPPEIGKDGLLMEWAKEFEDPETHHRHMSHMFGLFPGNSITPMKTPALCQAASRSMMRRGDSGPGWSMAWKIALWSRLWNAQHAYQLVKTMFTFIPADTKKRMDAGGIYANLFNAHPPFQIDGNFGFTAGVAEMLLQSDEGNIFLLPALPDKWVSGKVKGLRARGDMTVDIVWEMGMLVTAKLFTGNNTCCAKHKVHYNWRSIQLDLSFQSSYLISSNLEFHSF